MSEASDVRGDAQVETVTQRVNQAVSVSVIVQRKVHAIPSLRWITTPPNPSNGLPCLFLHGATVVICSETLGIRPR